MPEGKGVRLVKSKAAFCGNWKNGRYQGNGLYIWHDESVQEGMLHKGAFNGESQEVTANGKVKSGTCRDDKF